MKSANNGVTEPQRVILSPNEALKTKIGLYLIELLAKGASLKSMNNFGYCQDYQLLSTN